MRVWTLSLTDGTYHLMGECGERREARHFWSVERAEAYGHQACAVCFPSAAPEVAPTGTVDLFVYGTLRAGYHRHPEGVEVLGEDHVRGRLYYAGQVGNYPLLVLDDSAGVVVVGDVLRFADSGVARHWWEYIVDMEVGAGYVLRDTTTITGRPVAVWHYPHDVRADLLIPSGDWVGETVGFGA